MLGSMGSVMLLSSMDFSEGGQNENPFNSRCGKVASITPLGEWLHDYKKGGTNSRMQLRSLC